MKADDLIALILEEVQHCVINDERSKDAESALAACMKKSEKPKRNKKDKTKSDITCKNCKRTGHRTPDCYQKGGGKEGQAPWNKKKTTKNKESEMVVVTADDDENELFVFTCMSDHAAIAEVPDIPKSKLGTCIDSGASRNYSPDHMKFSNYKSVWQTITTADGRLLAGVNIGDLHIELPNRLAKLKIVFKNTIHVPSMAFTLISISRLDKAGFLVTFSEGMCTIKDPKHKMVATVPHMDGLYKLVSKQLNKTETANAASGKMLINEAHRKLGHIAYSAIHHALSNGLVTRINLDMGSKVEFCKTCAKAKSVRQPFPKELETWAEKFGKRIHWDLWGPASVKSLKGNQYVTARIDDMMQQTKVYFQAKKSQTFELYKKDKAFIETQGRNCIKICRSDEGRKFQSTKRITHQDLKGTKRELTVHDSPPQNGISERGM